MKGLPITFGGGYGGSTGINTTTPSVGAKAKSPMSNIQANPTTISPKYAASPQPSLGGNIATTAQATQLASGQTAPSQPTQGITQGATPSLTTPVAPINTSSTSNSANSGLIGSFPSLVSSLSSSGNGSPQNAQTAQTGLISQSNSLNPANGSIQGLSGIAQNQTPAVTAAEDDYNKFAQSNPYMLAAQSNPNVASDVASGRSSLLGQTFASELSAKQAAISNALAGQGQQITAGTNAGNLGLTGQAQQIGALGNAGDQALTGESQRIGALGNATSLAAPHFNGYVGIDPQTGSAINPGGAATAAVAGNLIDANATSASGLQGNINNIESSFPAANANFDILTGFGKNFAGDSPIVNSIKKAYGSSVEGNQAIAQFNAQIAQVEAQYKALTGSDVVIPPDVTPQQLAGIQQSLNQTINNNYTQYKNKLQGLQSGSTTTGSGVNSGTQSSGSYTSSSGVTYKLPY